jgi:outer membrane lipoprotein-sorting protein
MSSRVRRLSRACFGIGLAAALLLPATPALPQPSPTDGAGDDGAARLLDRALEAWRSHETISARFTQVQHFVGFDEPLDSTGRLRILRPLYFELKFDPPHRQLQICDGEWVWTYVEEEGQVFKSPLAPDAGRGADLLDWALAGSEVLPGVHPDTTLGVPAYRLDLRPGTNLPLRELHIWVEGGDGGGLIGYEAVDTEGNRTRMRLVEVDVSRDWEPDDFRFSPPEGVEVIEFGGSP